MIALLRAMKAVQEDLNVEPRVAGFAHYHRLRLVNGQPLHLLLAVQDHASLALPNLSCRAACSRPQIRSGVAEDLGTAQWGPTLIAPDRYGIRDRSAYSNRLGILRVLVTRRSKLSSSLAILLSASGCWEIRYLQPHAMLPSM